MSFVDKVKYDANGLVPAIVQDYNDGEVLMLAYMNKASLQATLDSKRATFWSRSRQKFWIKGESSGNIQEVKGLFYDCDIDTILVKVIQHGGAACHEGYRSCFFTQVLEDGTEQVIGERVFDPNQVYKK
ncbi:MAG: phosphoribosyl-AMP cyclohydrolase [Candidatus Auribacter fodinae]|jgi:phosphoribosyl-AMP cyclohydrolase|uniref:Phosphoribosyl-AMP cyclohydrolase n=1 Tax=Candidatus Auribacter fodinae TaxID=2093366 RepID=A0A3A4QWK7_9BACT|nr:MAG: phosphoribosyl-AMP cyclohydrolase [Candidatus Auribacter fodinae]